MIHGDPSRARSVQEEGGELVISAHSRKFLLESVLTGSLLASSALWSGCGSDGAGTIHIASSKSRRQLVQTGAGVAPTATAKPAPSGIPGKSAPRSAIKNLVTKKR
jgi:hypothetical protein